MTSSENKQSAISKTDSPNPSKPSEPQPSEPRSSRAKRLEEQLALNQHWLRDQEKVSDAGAGPPPKFDYLAQPTESVDVCPCCGSDPDQWRTLSTCDRYRLPVRFWYCTGCAFVFANPRMTPEAYGRFYAQGHYRRLVQSYSGDDPAPQTVFDHQQHHAGWLLQQFGPRLSAALQSGGRLLDLGGGPGGVAHGIARRIPCQVKVIDPAADEIATARAHGLDAEAGTAETWQPDGQYDVVLLLQTIDHLLDPLAALQKIRAICTRLLIVDLIDFPHWYSANQEHGKGGHHALKVDHPSNFHADGLQALLMRAGFATQAKQVVPLRAAHRKIMTFAARPSDRVYPDARPGPAAVQRIIRGAYQAHTWIGRYHAQPQ